MGGCGAGGVAGGVPGSAARLAGQLERRKTTNAAALPHLLGPLVDDAAVARAPDGQVDEQDEDRGAQGQLDPPVLLRPQPQKGRDAQLRRPRRLLSRVRLLLRRAGSQHRQRQCCHHHHGMRPPRPVLPTSAAGSGWQHREQRDARSNVCVTAALYATRLEDKQSCSPGTRPSKGPQAAQGARGLKPRPARYTIRLSTIAGPPLGRTGAPPSARACCDRFAPA